ncbi:MAG TPA: tetratricopeptide repeat-containing protein [Caulobacter sp.]|nr:tetratricopeptide repeat-containing protein [Caulobacter sp.]
MSPSLLPIIAHARAGALDHALRLFHDAGLDAVDDDPAVLALKGRLLKDQARRATGEARRALYARSAEAYGAAGAIGWATYPLINAASLSLLAGEPERARALAEKVLARLDQGDSEPDTPYWREATRAEAELLLGRTQESWLTLQGAIALAPRAWEDHAATLRQFALILAEQGEDVAWLEPLRPPRSLHFAGQLGTDPADADLGRRVAELLEVERIGFGFGALAAGADIVIAEALLDRGAELHLLLPAPQAMFRERSVGGLGAEWLPRFDKVVAAANTVTCVADRLDRLGVTLAARAAMGRAAMQARLLATEAIQLLAPDAAEPVEAGGSGWVKAVWEGAGRRTLVLPAPRAQVVTGGLPAPAGESRAVLALDAGAGGDLSGRLEALWSALDGTDAALAAPPVWTGSAVMLSFLSCFAAAKAARAVAPVLGEGRIAADVGEVVEVAGPGGAVLRVGTPVETAGRLLASAPPGAALVSELFAWVLGSETDAPWCPCEPIGELPARSPGGKDVPVYSLELS